MGGVIGELVRWWFGLSIFYRDTCTISYNWFAKLFQKKEKS